jgi:hypothetical protein
VAEGECAEVIGEILLGVVVMEQAGVMWADIGGVGGGCSGGLGGFRLSGGSSSGLGAGILCATAEGRVPVADFAVVVYEESSDGVCVIETALAGMADEEVAMIEIRFVVFERGPDL